MVEFDEDEITMPFTPLHLGPNSWIGILLLRVVDFPALLISGVIVDIEPIFILFFNLNYPFHGFFHSFLGSSILAVLTAVILYLFKGKIKKIMAIPKLVQDSSFLKILLTSFFGVWLHVLLDSPLYRDIKPFYPLGNNPFYGWFSLRQIYLFCGLSFLIGILFYLIKLLVFKKEKRQ